MATWDQREAVNLSAHELAPKIDELDLAGPIKLPTGLARPSRVQGSPAQFECRFITSLRLLGNGLMGSIDAVFGLVVGAHISESILDAQCGIDVLRAKPIALMGCYGCTVVDNKFDMLIPGGQRVLLGGLDGSAGKVRQATDTQLSRDAGSQATEI